MKPWRPRWVSSATLASTRGGWYDCPIMTPRSLLVVLLALGGAAACTPKVQEQYRVEIVGDLQRDYLQGGTRAVLEVNDKEVASTGISPGAPFQLTNTGINPMVEASAVFRVKVLDGANKVVAQGQSPEIELELASPPVVRVFIQKPGSFARSFDLDYPRRGMFAVAAPATVDTTTGAKPITVGFFGLGMVTVPGDNNGPATERPSEVLQLYNPVTQIIDDAGLSSTINGNRQPRTNAAATLHNDGKVLVFGGQVTVGTNPPMPSGQLDVVQLQRTGFDTFAATVGLRSTDTPGLPRQGAVMVDTDAAYAIGGRAGDQALDTVVAINPSSDASFTPLPQKMAGPREGHTATVVALPNGREVLVFGGAAPGVTVAEVLIAGPMLVTPSGPPGPPRRNHAAVALPGDDRVLVIGGRSDTGVLGDTVLYQGSTRSVGPGPITLVKPRYDFSAFVVGDDLVISGGYDASGALVNTAEIYGAADLKPKATDVPCYPRSGASVMVLPNRLVILAGGTEQVKDMPGMFDASSVVEIYQPLVK
jgi:hypothetical protein